MVPRGSILLWAAALLYPPPLATLILTGGRTAGALGAYLFARGVTRIDAARARGGRLFGLLERQGVLGPLVAIALLLLLGRFAYRR